MWKEFRLMFTDTRICKRVEVLEISLSQKKNLVYHALQFIQMVYKVHSAILHLTRESLSVMNCTLKKKSVSVYVL